MCNNHVSQRDAHACARHANALKRLYTTPRGPWNRAQLVRLLKAVWQRHCSVHPVVFSIPLESLT